MRIPMKNCWHNARRIARCAVIAAWLAGCAGRMPETGAPPIAETVPAPPGATATMPLAPAAPLAPADARALIEASLPRGVADRAGWSADITAAFTALGIAANRETLCAVIAVTAQESGFEVDPPVAHLGAIAWKEIDKRAEHAGVPPAIVHGVLQLPSPTGVTYAERIDRAHTEKELSDIFEDFTGSVPLGRSLFASWNPIRTRGPMQVSVTFAEAFAKQRPYPYPVKVSIADELFTRRGSLYFGSAHLLDYPAGYERYLYRFADYNAGQYASRNAAFQSALARVSGLPVKTDGALLAHEDAAAGAGSTESAARSIAQRLHLNEAAIHDALEQGKSARLERTELYLRVFALGDARAGRRLPRALVPHIKLVGPKLTRTLSTEWYAQRVDERFRQCVAR
jgi:hypothetical protein